VKSFTDLVAWQRAMELVDVVYDACALFPRDEQFGLISQLKRSSTSIVANIAEEFGRYTYPDKIHKYVIARGECTEVEAFLLIAYRRKFLSKEETIKIRKLCHEVQSLLSGLITASRKHL
jgi:four helix bundle protein